MTRLKAQPKWRLVTAAIVAVLLSVGGGAVFAATGQPRGLTFATDASLSDSRELARASVPAGLVYISAGVATDAPARLYLDDPRGTGTPFAEGSLATGIAVDLSGLAAGTIHSILVDFVGPSGSTIDYYARFVIGGGTGAPVAPTADPVAPPASPPVAAPTAPRAPVASGGDEPLQGLPERNIFDASMVGTGQVISADPASANPQPGDVVEIPAGTYQGFTPASGSNGAYVSYRAAQGASVIIEGGMQMDGASYVHLDGITIANSPGFALELTGSNNIALTNIGINGSQDGGMRIYDVQGLYVEGANIQGTNARGTDAASEALSLEQVSNFELLNNRVHDNGEEGIDVKYGSSDGSVHHNAAWANRGPNIYIDGASNVDIHHNWAWDATSGDKPGIMLAAEAEWSDGNISNITVRNNTVWGNGAGSITLWQGNFSGIVIENNVIAGGDALPDGGGGATVSNNVEGPIPDVSAIVGSTV